MKISLDALIQHYRVARAGHLATRRQQSADNWDRVVLNLRNLKAHEFALALAEKDLCEATKDLAEFNMAHPGLVDEYYMVYGDWIPSR